MTKRNRPTVSVVIPVYNGERFVADAIRSVLNQSYPPLECIVVDDGSTDGTSNVVSRFQVPVRYVAKSNGGVSSARNVGIELAKGDLVAFLDADDLWEREKLEKQIESLMHTEGAGLSYCGVQLVDAQLRPLGVLEVAPPRLALRNTLLLEKPFVSSASTSLAPADTLAAVGGFDERLSTSADCDLLCRIACRYPLAYTAELLTRYRCHSGQMHANLAALEHDMLLVFDKLFSDDHLPEDLRGLRRRAVANLEFTLAVGSQHKGHALPALRHFWRAVRSHPPRTLALATLGIGSRWRAGR
jgi:glycosyltransferase involved in cell wall biosynthesis